MRPSRSFGRSGSGVLARVDSLLIEAEEGKGYLSISENMRYANTALLGIPVECRSEHFLGAHYSKTQCLDEEAVATVHWETAWGGRCQP